MMYRVIVSFRDLQDERHAYRVGDEFPRSGLKVSKKRITELASDKNRRGMPLIKKVEGKKNDSNRDVPISEKLV